MKILNLVYIFTIIGIQQVSSSAAKRPNVLFIMLDDFRPAIGGYGDEKAYTPNIDQLLNKSVYFTNVFAQQAICAPSRNSMLTSRAPDTLHLYDFYSYWRTFAGNFTTLPEYFKTNGYNTFSIGKIFHPGISSNFTDDFPYSWSEPAYHPSSEEYMRKNACYDNGKYVQNILCPVEMNFEPEKTLPDIQSLQKAQEFLNQSSRTEPFFLAVGFHKPHIPFKFPAKYLSYHDLHKFRDDQDLNYRPFLMPTVAWNPYTDVRDREDVKALNISFPFGPMPEDFKLKMKQHYYAAVTYVDSLIGELLKTVDFDNTVIALTSDHGWSLGEHAEWAKYSNFDVALKVPLIIYSPKFAVHKKIVDVVSLLDVFPTLVDIAELPEIQGCPAERSQNVTTCTEGKTLLPLILDKIDDEAEFVAFSQYPRPGDYPTTFPNSDKPKLYQIKIMGYSIRTHQYRYTAWIQFSPSTFERDWKTIYGEELYDHSIDPKENINLITRSELNYVQMFLQERLKTQFP